MEDLTHDYGRLYVAKHLTPEKQALAQTLPTMHKQGGAMVCWRCASLVDPLDSWLPIDAYYCRSCIGFGRVRSDQVLYYFPQLPFSPQDALNWQGSLTPWQSEISDALCRLVAEGQDSLVHAVTGAGKTEMIYQVIGQALAKGQAVCIASPRIDVCLELHRRLSQDFSCPIALLYGDGDPYRRSPLVIATTHQLLKFYQAFDLLIVDEVDAFPFVDNAMLYHALDTCLAKGGRKIFLTATTTDRLDKQVASGSLSLLRLPRRFHENPLVLPQKVWLSSFRQNLDKGRLPKKLLRDIADQRQTGFPLLIFASEIRVGQAFAKLLQSQMPNESIGFVSSQTDNRSEQVMAFREGKLSILVSTTILERGVTFPGVDVFVLEANHRLFSKSSLVQISGRVGRSQERPTGLLYFYQDGTTTAIERAIAEIRLMNKESGL